MKWSLQTAQPEGEIAYDHEIKVEHITSDPCNERLFFSFEKWGLHDCVLSLKLNNYFGNHMYDTELVIVSLK